MQNKDKINTPGTEHMNAAKPGTAVALGMFDGMHVGHKKIIDAAVLIARQSGLVPAVFTFKNHPQELFGKKILRLCSNETRAALMRRQGIELVDEVEFTSAIRDLSAESFIRMLAERLNPKIIVAGFNYTFGKKKQGNSETLQRLCQKYGILQGDDLLSALEAKMPTPFVHGRGHRRSELQRDIEALRRLEAQKAKYAAYQDTFRGRNSFSKTDPDATFMHMKEDHMHNAQLMYFQSQYGRKSCSALSLPGIKVPRKNLSSILTRSISPDGDGTIMLKGILTLFFLTST